MKAKEYNKKLTELLKIEHKDRAIFKILKEMFLEVSEIRKIRRANSDPAIISIFNEMNKKCNAFIRNANKEHNLMLKNDAFKLFVSDRDESFSKLIGW